MTDTATAGERVPVRALRTKARKLLKLRQETARLERELKAEAIPHYRDEGCIGNPRIERILERFAA